MGMCKHKNIYAVSQSIHLLYPTAMLMNALPHANRLHISPVERYGTIIQQVRKDSSQYSYKISEWKNLQYFRILLQIQMILWKSKYAFIYSIYGNKSGYKPISPIFGTNLSDYSYYSRYHILYRTNLLQCISAKNIIYIPNWRLHPR